MQTVIHSVIVFVLIWVVLRIVGKREMSQISPFDFVILVVLGDLVAEGVVAEDTSLTGAFIAVATISLLTVALSWLSWRLPKRARPLFEGTPTLLIKGGELIEEALRIERLDLNDLHEAARADGIRDLNDIEWAVLEADGTFSFFKRQ